MRSAQRELLGREHWADHSSRCCVRSRHVGSRLVGPGDPFAFCATVTPSAASARSRIGKSGRIQVRWCDGLTEAFFEQADLVANLRGPLEIELFGRFEHLSLELFDVLLRHVLLFGRDPRRSLDDLPGGDFLFDPAADGLADRFRLDAMLGVVGQLRLRRRAVSSIASCMLSVTLSAYKTTSAFTFRAERPIVWIRLVWLRRKPSLSASRIATSETSGKSSPSRSRFTPTTASNFCSRSSRSTAHAFECIEFGVKPLTADAFLDEVTAEILR